MKRLTITTLSLILLIVLGVQLTVYITKNTTRSNSLDSPTMPIMALAAEPDTITIDYANQTATGSPLVFGGAHAPELDHQDAWDLLAEAGMTLMRRDFWIEQELPNDITLEDYKANKNNVQDPSMWNQDHINTSNSIYQNAQKRGMRVMAILSYAPPWLTHTDTEFGVPKDWDVYEDIVKKSYRLHRPYLDMIEIWNEPDIQQFLDPSGSGLSRKEAYAKIFEHAVKAIKSVDAEIGDSRSIPIIAPAAALPQNTRIFD